MKTKVLSKHDGHGLVFRARLTAEIEEDELFLDLLRRQSEFMDLKIQPRSFLYLFEITENKDSVDVGFSEQVERPAKLKNGSHAKVIEIEV